VVVQPPTRWPAPAKLNLFLHVTARRADGYHELQTLFQLVDLCDTIEIQVTPDGSFTRPLGPEGVSAEDDLTLRAARALQQASGSALGARISIHKRIPQGGGLGGGSSDAATVLLALNQLWDLRMPIADLARIGVALGADVPVFVHGSTAWAEGVGERLTPVTLPPRWYLIVHPGVGVSTREVFQSPELTRNSPLITIRAFFDSGGRNDCEPVVRRHSKEVAAALDWLGRSHPAQLTGTGACVFAAFETAEKARDVAKQVPGGWRGFVARGLDISPAHEQLRRRA
jgi:4-diphosphocytidyl-2-C-methyl-D-erythritol kinase